MSNITYTEKDDLLYPNLTAGTQTEELGKYAVIARSYLLEEKINLFQEWMGENKLIGYLQKLDERYRTLRVDLTEKLQQKHPFQENGEFLTKAQYLNQIYQQAEEIVLAQLTEELEAL